MSARRERAGQKLSFRTLLLIAVACTAGVFLICALLILRSGHQISNHYVEGVGAETLKYYQLTLDHTLEVIDDYCGANFEDGSTAPLFQAEDPTQGAALRNAAGEQLQILTQTHNAYYAGILPADPSAGAAVIRSQCGSIEECDALTSALTKELDAASAEPGWQWHSLDGKPYLCNVKRLRESYTVVLLSSHILSNLSDAQGGLYLFCVDHGNYITGNADVGAALSAQRSGEHKAVVNGRNYLILTRPVQEGQFDVGMLLASSGATIRQELLRSGLILLLILFGVLALVFGLFRQISGFFSNINDACLQIGSGNLDTQITQPARLVEEDRLYHTFNQMTQQIKDLRINLYEQELSAQQSKTRFLQTQIKSHFFLNCLNTIHSLALVKDTDLIEEFALCLSDYFRYLGSGFSDTVRFSSELLHLQNYINLNQIRYPDRIVCTWSIDPEIADCEILPMLPQTFVENVFKHALGANNVLHLNIRACSAEENGRKGMRLTIEDDGPGFTAEQLAQLNDPDNQAVIPSGAGPGTGIQNSRARMWLHYGFGASVRFENAPEHGAIVRLFFSEPGQKEETT